MALWALDNGGWKQDQTTAAVAEYLLIRQSDLEHYKPESIRPPSERSHFTSTYVALRGLKVYGLPQQQERIQARIAKVREWLITTPPEETEDRVFRLRALPLVAASDETIRQAADELRTQQREDGGWSQLPDLQSDSYATGSVLVALNEMGGLATDDPCYRKALRYLISVQQPDGSWYVASRSKPFQTYFESGYPHGKDQFISMSAASWATTALTAMLPKVQQVMPQRREWSLQSSLLAPREESMNCQASFVSNPTLTNTQTWASATLLSSRGKFDSFSNWSQKWSSFPKNDRMGSRRIDSNGERRHKLHPGKYSISKN